MNKELEVNHKVLGLNGTEKEVEVKFKSFCQLCKRSLNAGDSAILLEGDNGWTFYIHVDCAIAQMTRLHNKIFREEVKVRTPKQKTNQQTKKLHTADNPGYCSFCNKKIASNDKFFKEKKKRFHPDCHSRYVKVLKIRKNDLR